MVWISSEYSFSAKYIYSLSYEQFEDGAATTCSEPKQHEVYQIYCGCEYKDECVINACVAVR